VLKIPVGREQYELVPDTQLSEQSVDRAGLNTTLAASIAKLGSGDVIFTIWSQERKGGEVLDDLQSGLRSREALEKLLKYQPRREDSITAIKRTGERTHLWTVARLVSPQEQRPDAGVYEQAHETRPSQERERSLL